MTPADDAVRVAFVLHMMQVAGAEVLVLETIRRLGGRITPTVLCLDAIGELGERARAEGVPVLSFNRRPGRDWRVARLMAGELRRRRVQVIHAHQYTRFFYSALARAFAGGGPPLIFTEHGRHYPDVVGRGRRMTNRWLLSRAANEVNAVCAFSAEALRSVDGFSAVPVGVIENGVDLDKYWSASDAGAARAAVGLDPAKRYILHVARFHPVKDHATLVTAFAALSASRPDVNLALAGDGPLRSSIEAAVRERGLEHRVLFLGVRQDVPALLRAATVFCLNSVSEAASLTLMEAMASGLPIVVTDVGGNPEIVRRGVDGLLVPRGDAAALAQALGDVLDDPALGARLGASAAARARQRYSIVRTVERYDDLYRSLVNS